MEYADNVPVTKNMCLKHKVVVPYVELDKSMPTEFVYVIMETLPLMEFAKDFHVLIPIISMIPSVNPANVKVL